MQVLVPFQNMYTYISVSRFELVLFEVKILLILSRNDLIIECNSFLSYPF